MIEHCYDIRDRDGPGIRGTLMRFVTGTMSTGINEDKVIVVPQRLRGSTYPDSYQRARLLLKPCRSTSGGPAPST
jgi:hypothetical protein